MGRPVKGPSKFWVGQQEWCTWGRFHLGRPGTSLGRPRPNSQNRLWSSIATMSLSCTISEILSRISQKLNRSRDSEHILFGSNISYMHSLSHTPLYQSVLEIRSAYHQLQRYDRGKTIFKTSHMTLTTPPLNGSFVTVCQDLIQSTCMQNLTILASAVPED